MIIKQIYFSFYIVGFLVFASCSKKSSLPLESQAQKLIIDIQTLSADDMEGREIGTEGEKKAGEFISKRFKEIGLLPAGDDQTYFQGFSKKKNGNPHGEETSSIGIEVKGKNVIGFIDNGSENTVIIGGHYDHLGFGSEGSLYVGAPEIHNGADDNSSGVAGVLFLAETIKISGLKNHNYMFICFSGEEKGLWGSNYFINHTAYKNKISYMINMDMIGRLNSDRKLAVSGIGTSPEFESIISDIKTPKFNLKKDLSGMGPSDHASFYNAEIPVLAFFTGQHSDYHKPSDDAHLINFDGVKDITQYIYKVISKLDKKGKLPFTKTKDETQERMSFSVTLGVMPDYLFDGKGMKIDGVKDGKPASLSGMEKGDIVVKMGDLEVIDMQSYMKCLSIFKQGQNVDVIIVRNGLELVKKVKF